MRFLYQVHNNYNLIYYYQKIEIEGEIKRRGDSIYKVSNEISKEEMKKFCIGIIFLTFFKNNNLIK